MTYDEYKALEAQKKSRKKPQQNEHNLQKACVCWFTFQHPEYEGLLFAVPNGGSRNAVEAKKLKAEGVVPGVSDLILDVPNFYYHGLRIELKYGTNKQSEDQRLYESRVTGQGYKYVVCYTVEEFINEVNQYLKYT